MRAARTVQPSLFQPPAVVHPVAAQLERASSWLDQHPCGLNRCTRAAGMSVRRRISTACSGMTRGPARRELATGTNSALV